MSDRTMAEQSAKDMLECMEIENGYDASWYVDTAASLIADRDALAERCEKLREAAKAFIEKYDSLEPAVNNAFLMQQIHGAPYRGDNWAAELAALRALAAPKDAP